MKQLHREYLRAGADVCQAFTFYASEDKLKNRGNSAGSHGISFVELAIFVKFVLAYFTFDQQSFYVESNYRYGF